MQWSKAGYVEYQFFDKEANFLPYKVGTYLGTKKMFNIGAGFYTAPKGTQTFCKWNYRRASYKFICRRRFLRHASRSKKKKNGGNSL
jgi:hypothetical protein